MDYSPRLNCKSLLLKKTLIYEAEHAEVELVPNLDLHPYWLAFLVLEGTLYATEEKGNHQYLTDTNSCFNMIVF